MRYQLLKMKKKISTKYERRFMEILKVKHIKFKAKQKIYGREVDFVIGNYAIDINGHMQDYEKNIMLVKSGYIPIHYNNVELKNINLDYLCH